MMGGISQRSGSGTGNPATGNPATGNTATGEPELPLYTTGEEPPSGETNGELPLLTTGELEGGMQGGVKGPNRLGWGAGQGSWALLDLLLAIGAVVLGILTALVGKRYNLYQRVTDGLEDAPLTYEQYLNESNALRTTLEYAREESNRRERRRRYTVRGMALALASLATALLTWIITQHITGRMVLVDRWTIAFAFLFAITLVVHLQHRHEVNSHE